MVIDFDETEVTYGRKDWIQITLAYCTSIHKSQGSEFKMVILPMVQQYSVCCNGICYIQPFRGLSLLILLGDLQAFERCVQNLAANRKTTLKKRLITVFEGEQTEKNPAPAIDKDNEKSVMTPEKQTTETEGVLTLAKVQSQAIDPMIGMNGITPQSFMPA